jgi:ABC-2 type transport system ATP-binding protein
MEQPSAVSVAELSHRYGELLALADVSFEVRSPGIFGLLGPNGGGKSTLFRLLATLLPVQSGSVRVMGFDARRQPDAVRSVLGVTFQSASLDRKLSVRENLRHQGHLHGLWGAALRRRIDELLARLGLADRAGDRVESLSGGLARRVEVAKGLLHQPRVLLLDEPSSGLDPGARLDLWVQLRELRDNLGVVVLLTTHLMEEAERCDHLGILDKGRLVALGTPDGLRDSLGSQCLTLTSDNADLLSRELRARFQLESTVAGEELRVRTQEGRQWMATLLDSCAPLIRSIALARPTLEDVFVQRTGHRFLETESSAIAAAAGSTLAAARQERPK